ncbi:MAG: Veg family protein [Christensenellales bacterium]
MREINNNISGLMENVRALTGVRVKIKVNRGRNRIELIEGVLENAYPNIFTVRKQTGELNSFSYADIIANNVKFLK